MRLRCPLSRVGWQARGVAGISEGCFAKTGHPPGRALAELAGRQWGVRRCAQLRALGIGRARRCSCGRTAGRLHRVHRGVYAVGHRMLRPEGHRLAAVLACGPGAVLSHRSAAAHWGLLATSQQRIDVTAPRGRHGVPGIRLHTSRSLDAQDTTSHEGIPITTVHRTLLDLAATVRDDQLERALAQAMYLQLYDQRAIDDVIARSNGHRGTSVLKEATRQEPQITKSMWEIRMLGSSAAPNLPEPICNKAAARPRPRRVQARLLLARVRPDRRDRRLGGPPHAGRLPQRPRQGRRAHRRRVQGPAVHLGRRRRHHPAPPEARCFRIDPCASPSPPTSGSGSPTPSWRSSRGAGTTSSPTARSTTPSATTGPGRPRRRRATSPTGAPSRPSCAAGPGRAPRSPPTRSRGSAPRCASTRPPRPARASGTTRTCWRSACAPRRRPSSREILDAWFASRAERRARRRGQRRAPGRHPVIALRRAGRARGPSSAGWSAGRASSPRGCPRSGGYEVIRPPATMSHRAGHAWEQVVLPAQGAARPAAAQPRQPRAARLPPQRRRHPRRRRPAPPGLVLAPLRPLAARRPARSSRRGRASSSPSASSPGGSWRSCCTSTPTSSPAASTAASTRRPTPSRPEPRSA